MTINQDILEAAFTNFTDFVLFKSGEKFEAFATSKYLKNEENYKYEVYNEARNALANKHWKPEDIGTGEIQKKVSSAIKARVNYNFEMIDNNLVDWRQKDDFSKKTNSELLESTLFNFYKSKIKDSEAFERFMSEKLSYQFIAYLFFIKDSQKFLPISQERFDKIFQKIGLFDFKTSRNASWGNYNEFCSIIKEVQKFLKTKDKNTTLLDAHSFLWILGNQMEGFNSHDSVMDAYGLNYIIEDELIENPEPDNNIELVEILQTVQNVDLLSDEKYADELPLEISEGLFEGIKRTITVNSYERNPKARQICIAYWKAICAVCSFDFEQTYGEIGKGFIHVHHLVKISDIGDEYEVDPINDLIPVCPNCHSMLHKKEPPIPINELKSIIKASKLS